MTRTRRTRRSSTSGYDQFCGLARALDVIGDRWTLLIVRELLYLGPRRFTDLKAGLPGIATNLLTARLRALETYRLVRRVHLPPPAASLVYHLTTLGAALEPAVRALLEWGLHFVGAPPRRDQIRPELPLMAFRAGFRSALAQEVQAVYHICLDDRVFEIEVDRGALRISEAAARRPLVTMTTDRSTFAAIAMRRTTGAAAIAAGKASLEGKPTAIRTFLRLFARHPEVPCHASA